MTIVTRATAKSYFETGDKPSQSQFGDLIDGAMFNEDFSVFGKAFVSAATTASAINMLGFSQPGTVGNILLSANTTASAQNQLGVGAVGRNVFEATTTASARTVIEAQTSAANLTALAGLTGAADKIPYFTGAGTMALTNLPANRNVLINGAMGIDQRNAGAAQTITAAAALAYTVDRWYAYCTGANVTGQRVAGTAPNQYNYQFTGAASVTKIGFAQRIEVANSQHLAGQTATLSVDLANSLLTTVTWVASYANTNDTFGTLASPTKTQIATGTFTVSSTLTRFNANISIPSAATTGIEIEFSVGAQTSGTLTIGRAQLELGSAASAFEYRAFQGELDLCKNYYRKSFPYATAPAQNAGTAGVLNNISSGTAAGSCQIRLRFDPAMRISPVMTFYNPSAANALFRDVDAGADSNAAATQYAGTSGVNIFNNGTTTDNRNYGIHATFDSEL